MEIKINNEIEMIQVENLKPQEKNVKIHTVEQIELLAENIKKFGFNNPILIDEENNIIAGHGRLEASKYLDLTEVPAIILKNLSEDEKKAIMIADNKITELGDWNLENLQEQLKEIDGELINLTGFELPELEEEDLSSLTNNEEVQFDTDTSLETAERYIDGDIKRIVLYFFQNDFLKYLKVLKKIQANENLKDNTEAFKFVMEKHIEQNQDLLE